MKDTRVLIPRMNKGLPEVSVQQVQENLGKMRLIDVRRSEEFNNELGHIQGAELVPLGPELTQFLQKGDRSEEIVFICRSGVRSGIAAAESQRLGYNKTANMIGGMILWNECHYPVERT